METFIILFVALIIGSWEVSVAKRISLRREFFCREKFTTPPLVPNLYQRLLKRIVDIAVSLSVCICILPILYIVLGILIKLTSKGPIIFSQKRKGLLGDEFVCYKFRSMYEASPYAPTIFDESRVTPIGRFIRKTHLDEFPQFFNVLIGDMSLVGARPASVSCDDVLRLCQDYPYRLLLRPGITGLSQVNSQRWLNTQQVIRLDKYYFSHVSLGLDVRIILRTLQFADKTM